jgi:hypothetical protein
VASGRPSQPNDPSIMASVEAALSTVSRPGLIARMWHWRAPGWPYRDRSEAGGTESEEPALYYGLGLHRPLG